MNVPNLSLQFASAFYLVVLAAGSPVLADLPPLSPTAIANGATITRAQGYEFVTVGAPGNAPVSREQQASVYLPGLGTVNQPYAIARTEVTYGEYIGFVRAYASIHGITQPNRDVFLGFGISFAGGNQFDPNQYHVGAGYENTPVEVGWRFAARYCNWLSNDKSPSPSAFETGSYDGSTFLPIAANGVSTSDNVDRLPGAKFFMPTFSEWTKAMYFDQNRYGPGQAGYWKYPTTSDLPAISGLPGDGGQTNRGLWQQYPLPTAMYPTVQSPWGLFDGSGGATEWIEGGFPTSRFSLGTDWFGNSFYERVGLQFGNTAAGVDSLIGLRLAMSIPSNGAGTLFILLSAFVSRRNRKY